METPAGSPEAALAHYPVPGPVALELSAIDGGLVNDTWRVGAVPVFALQLVSAAFGDAENRHLEAVGERLSKADFGTTRLVRTRRGALSLAGPEGRRWRLLSWLPGTVHDELPSPAHAHSAARLIARFHDHLHDSPEGQSLPLSAFHDTAKRMTSLQAVLPQATDAIQSLGEAIFGAWTAWQRTAPPPPPRPGHGDLKISNVVFRGQSAEARGLIDYDTLGRYGLDDELGDALRSWCNGAREESPKPALDLEVFEAAVSGYFGISMSLLPSEREAIVHGFGRIALELAARFLTDAVEDRYFAWNPRLAPDRKAHNLLRARGQYELAREVARRRLELEAIVRRY